jgi:GntR family transcriptional regulator
MDVINRESPTPLYEQLKLLLREQIMLGSLAPGQMLPTEQAYCEMYGISRITVSRALRELEHEKLVKRIQGKGTIVTYPNYKSTMQRLKGFTRTVKEAGNVTRSQILSFETLMGNTSLLNVFGLPLDQEAKFSRIRRLRFINDVPAVIMTAIMRESLGERMKDFQLETASFYSLYEEILGIPVIKNEAQLTPITATPDVAKLLNVKVGSPHFLFRSVSYLEGDIPVELCIATFHGNMFHFSTDIYRLRNDANFPAQLETSEIAKLTAI